MEPVDDLERRIRESYELLREFEAIRQDTDNPKEKHRCEREISRQWDLIEGYLAEYFNVSRNLDRPVPADIHQIAAHFPRFLADDFRQAYAALRSALPEGVEALDQLIQVIRELGHLHAHLNEWKEMHNLLQECITSLIPLKGELESVIEYSEHWKKTSSLRLWSPCRTQLHLLESFAQSIKYIDKPFRRDEGAIRGPSWMIAIAVLRDDFEICLREGDPETIYNLTLDLWDTCYDALYQADKRLRDKVGELYMLSNALRSVQNDHNG
jgi:hypothetical protein